MRDHLLLYRFAIVNVVGAALLGFAGARGDCSGLVDENRKSGWMRDRDKAVFAQKRAVDKAEQIRVELR